MKDITVEELKNRLANNEKLIIFDVREEWEYDEQNAGFKNLPLNSIPQQIDDLEHLKNEEVIVHCKSGNRSANAKAYLKSVGFYKCKKFNWWPKCLFSNKLLNITF